MLFTINFSMKIAKQYNIVTIKWCYIEERVGSSMRCRSISPRPSSISESPEPLSLTERQRGRQRSGSSPPPLPPAAELAPTLREFKLVRLQRSSAEEELGIYIAKTRLSKEGTVGYTIAHIVPSGLADRWAQETICFTDNFWSSH